MTRPKIGIVRQRKRNLNYLDPRKNGFAKTDILRDIMSRYSPKDGEHFHRYAERIKIVYEKEYKKRAFVWDESSVLL